MPYRNNTEYSGKMRPYRFWRLVMDKHNLVLDYLQTNGAYYPRILEWGPTTIELRDVHGTDLTPLAISKPTRYWDTTKYFSVAGTQFGTSITLTWEWDVPVLIHSSRIVSRNPFSDLHYEYSWDGQTWVRFYTEDGDASFAAHGTSSYDETKVLW